MTASEAIEIIKVAIAEVEWDYPMEYSVAFEVAISALKKQIPKKPLVKTHKYIGSDDDFTSQYYCPVCNTLIINEDTNGFYAGKKTKYCDCGQALDWSDTE